MGARAKQYWAQSAALVISAAATIWVLATSVNLQPRLAQPLSQAMIALKAQTIKEVIPSTFHPLASIYYLTQALATRHDNPTASIGRQIYDNLYLSLRLDPYNRSTYSAAANYLAAAAPHGRNEPLLAMDLLQLGLESQPNDFQLRYRRALLFWFEFANYAKAANEFQYIRHHTNIPPDWFKISLNLQTSMHLKAGQYRHVNDLMEYHIARSDNKDVRQQVYRIRQFVKSMRILARTNEKIAAFHRQNSHLEMTWPLLLERGVFKKVPRDRYGLRLEIVKHQARIATKSPVYGLWKLAQ